MTNLIRPGRPTFAHLLTSPLGIEGDGRHGATQRTIGRLVCSLQFLDQEGLPKSRRPPERMPGIDRPDSYARMRDWSELSLLTFAIELPPGSHVLAVRYRAKASGADEAGYPTATWQFPYVLAPAREWGSFGGLDLTVYLPDGWESANTPLLERDGSVLRGTFSDLPADVLNLAVRAPVGPELRRASVLYGCLYIPAVIGGRQTGVRYERNGNLRNSPAQSVLQFVTLNSRQDATCMNRPTAATHRR